MEESDNLTGGETPKDEGLQLGAPLKKKADVQEDPRYSINVEQGFVIMRDSVTGIQAARQIDAKGATKEMFSEMKSEIKKVESTQLGEDQPFTTGHTLPGLQTKQSRSMYEHRNEATDQYPGSLATHARSTSESKDDGKPSQMPPAAQEVGGSALSGQEKPDPSRDPRAEKTEDRSAHGIEPGDKVAAEKAMPAKRGRKSAKQEIKSGKNK